jgi:UDP:flavonoid glycosyltransferase YjiC (YdhE family)
MRVLFTSTSGAGHFGPLVPFATAVRSAGHEILVAAPVSAQARVERAGLPFISHADPPDSELGPFWARVQAVGTENANSLVLRDLFAGLRARAALPGVELAIDAWRPDVVVRESCEFAGAVAAEARGVPHARVGIFLAAAEAMLLGETADRVGELREWAGLAADPRAERLAAAPYLTLNPPSLEGPGEQPATVRRYHAAPPPLRLARSRSTAPLVYMSFGSVAPTMGFYPGVYRAVIDALATLRIRLVVTVGEAADPAALGPVPANVRVERWIPQAEVFREADVMVGHGGFGTTHGALLAAVPQVVVPLFADQPDNARRIEALGAGLTADKSDPAAIRAAVERLLEEPSFRLAAGRVALEAQTLPPIAEAAGALEALVEEARGRRAA